MDKIYFLSRVYAWSVALEPLLFFVIPVWEINRANISRFLQLIVLIGLMLNWFLKSKSAKLKIINFANPLYRYYFLYFILALFAGFIGIFSGAYHISSSPEQGLSGFTKLVRGHVVRSILEYFIALYYFFYFFVLSQYLFKSRKSVNYLLRVLKITFIICFVAGTIDLVFSAVNHPLITRHLGEEGVTVGVRFHGFAGEPRDAFAYLFFGLAILHLQAYLKGVALNKWWIPVIIIAAITTNSTSGLLGIVFFIALYCIYGLRKISLINIAKLSAFVFLVIVLLFIVVKRSERVQGYINSASGIWQVLDNGGEIPYLMRAQIPNIYPIYDLIVKFRNLNILPIIIGSGLGSASVLNNQFFNVYELRNPNSQFVRLIYEIGVAGIFLFISAFVYPVKYLIKHLLSRKQEEFILIILLLLGCLFGHRNATIFIYLGVFIAVFRVLNKADSSGARSNLKT